MPAECKELTCCDLNDFPQTSSANGNCPTGYHWNGSYCAVGACVYQYYENGDIMTDENGFPMCFEQE